jgi:hypothetical protein
MYQSAERRGIAHDFGYTNGDKNGRYQGGGRREEKLIWGGLYPTVISHRPQKPERHLCIENKRRYNSQSSQSKYVISNAQDIDDDEERLQISTVSEHPSEFES